MGRLTAASELRALALTRGQVGEELKAASYARPAPRSLVASLRSGADVAVIAEIKRRSPSRGVMNAALDAGVTAARYASAGARGLSVLTEPDEFGGSLTDLDDAAEACDVPLLRKDFIVRVEQLWEARAHGASAVLLIARALAPLQLIQLAREGARTGLDVLVEVRTAEELSVAIESGAGMIGVNARNLETLVIEPQVVLDLLPRVPPDRVAVAESGMTDRGAIERVALAGADAVLVGSALTQAADAAALLTSFLRVPRRPRHD